MPPTFRLAAWLPLLLAAVPAWADDPKPADKPDPKPAAKADEIVVSSAAGVVAGEVVKVENGSITVKVPEVTQAGTTRQKVGGHTVTVPKLGTKMVETSYPLADKVAVRTVGGKESDLASVTAGTTVELHIDKVKTGKVGEKLDSHLEVKRIDIPNPTPAKK